MKQKLKQKPMSKMGLIEYLDRISPKTCRLIARSGTANPHLKPITPEEIAAKVGITVRRAIQIGRRDTWSGLEISLIEKYRAACGVTFATERRNVAYLIRSFNQSARPLRHINQLKKRDVKPLIKP